MQQIAGLDDLDDGAVGLAVVRDLEHGLVAVRVEALADRVELDHVVPLQDRVQFLLGQLYARQQGLQPLVARTVVRRRAFDRAAEIVGDGEQVPKQGDGGVLGHVGALALGAAARVLGLGQGPQELVLELRHLALERRDPVFGRCLAAGRLGILGLRAWRLRRGFAGRLPRFDSLRGGCLLGFTGFWFGLGHASEELLLET